jgi:stage V sporulation protein R
MNEGWACFWHYKILNSLDLPQSLHLEFIKRHNQVIASHPGTLNPYHLGFRIFCQLEGESRDNQFIFDVREQERDVSFLHRYLNEKLCRELNLFEFHKDNQDYVVSEVSDPEGWKKIRETLTANVGMNGIPIIRVKEIGPENILSLEHDWDGRSLQEDYAHQTLKYIARLWGNQVRLRIHGALKMLISDGK